MEELQLTPIPVNTSYTIGAIVAGFFLGGPTADYLGRRWGMFIGCALTIIATMMQTFTPSTFLRLRILCLLAVAN